MRLTFHQRGWFDSKLFLGGLTKCRHIAPAPFRERVSAQNRQAVVAVRWGDGRPALSATRYSIPRLDLDSIKSRSGYRDCGITK